MLRISVIVPVYNVESYIEKCLSSLLAQTYTNFEIIVVDDQSPDQSISLAYALLSNQITVPFKIITSEQNKGLSAARNLGIRNAGGEFLLFIDSDDWVEPDMLKNLITAVDTEKADMGFCRVRQVYSNSDNQEVLASLPAGSYSNTQAIVELFRGTYPAHICKILIARVLFEKISFPEGKIYEDVLTLPYLLLSSRNVVFIDNISYNYLQRQGSITKSFNPKIEGVIDQLFIMERELETYIDKDIIIPFKRYIYLTYHVIASHLIYFSSDYNQIKVILLKCQGNIKTNNILKILAQKPSKTIASLLMLKINAKFFYQIFKK